MMRQEIQVKYSKIFFHCYTVALPGLFISINKVIQQQLKFSKDKKIVLKWGVITILSYCVNRNTNS